MSPQFESNQLSLFTALRIEKCVEVRMNNVEEKHIKIRNKFNELYATKVDGMRLDLDSIVEKVASDFCLAPRTVKNILKRR